MRKENDALKKLQAAKEYLSKAYYDKEYGNVTLDIQQVKEIEHIARSNRNSWMLHDIGYLYLYGNGIESDKEKAVRLYHESFLMGCSKAATSLGMCYYKGYGVKENKKLAFYHFTKASLTDEPLSKVFLADMVFKGEMAKKDEQFAGYIYKRMFDMAFNDEDKKEDEVCIIASCALRLARCFLYAQGQREDIDEAEFYIGIAKYYFRALEGRIDPLSINGLQEALLLEKEAQEKRTNIEEVPVPSVLLS